MVTSADDTLVPAAETAKTSKKMGVPTVKPETVADTSDGGVVAAGAGMLVPGTNPAPEVKLCSMI
jgi:hypothetical protein